MLRLPALLSILLILLLAACEPAAPRIAEPLMPAAPGLDDLEARIIDVSAFAAPSVVLVRTRYVEETVIGPEGVPGAKEQTSTAVRVGSGMIWDSSGMIFTTASQVHGSLATFVELPDGRELPAEIKGLDELTDLAVLKVNAGVPLPVPDLMTDGDPKPGRWIVAVGALIEGAGTVAHGVVLADGRRADGFDSFEKLLQTNVTVTRELAGGPMLTLDGRVVGINIIQGSRPGIGYTVPLRTAMWVAGEILEHGRVERSFLGLSGSSLSPGQARVRGYEGRGAVMVAEVRPDTPASKAGVAPGDLIIAIEGKPIDDFSGMQRLISRIPPGTQVRVRLIRHEQQMEANATLQTAPDNWRLYESERPQGTLTLIGITTVALPEGVDQRGGLLVVGVDPSTPQEAADLNLGDVILEAEGFALSAPEQLATILWSQSPGTSLLLTTVRDGHERMVAVEVR